MKKLCLVLWSLSAAVFAQENQTSPSAAEILGKLKTEHPRLLASRAEFEKIKALTVSDAQLGKWHAELINQGNKALTMEPSKYEIPDGLRLLATSRRVLERVRLLGYCWQMTGDKQYADRAWAELSAAAAFPDWNPKHFLDTAEMTHAFAIGYDWMYDAWTPEQRAVLKNAIVEKGLKPALTVYRAGGWWTKSRFNWNQVCNGGIGMGALAVADEEPELCGEILEAALKSLPLAVSNYAPDGAWAEGAGYWAYATAYTVGIMAALESAVGTDFGLSAAAGFNKTGDFPLYFTAPNGLIFSYADMEPRPFNGAPEWFWLAAKFNQPLWTARQLAFADNRPSPLNVLWGARWLGKDVLLPGTVTLPVSRYFPGAEIVTMRGAWDDPLAVSVGFKAGDNKASHSHLDLGSFVLDALGHRWAEDLGRDDYNLPGYFGKERWTYYRLRAEGHNTLVINPSAAADQDPQAATKIERFEQTAEKTFAIADLTAAYAKHGALTVRRGMVLHADGQVLVQDEIKLKEPGEVWWFLHTRAKVELAADGGGAVLSYDDGSKLDMRINSSASVCMTVSDGRNISPPLTVTAAAPLPTSPHPARQDENKGVAKLVFHLPEVQEATISVWFCPFNGQDTPRFPRRHQNPLQEW